MVLVIKYHNQHNQLVKVLNQDNLLLNQKEKVF